MLNSLTSGARNYACGRAELRLVDAPHYRRDAFADGLASLGYTVSLARNDAPKPNDVLVLWNRYSRDEFRARAYEHVGASVLITENAWLGPEEKDRHLFALCKGHHNGAGSWPVGPDNRWARLSISLKPWRTEGDHILVLPQRGMGEVGVRMPKGWTAEALSRLARATKLPVKVQMHPGPRPHPEIDFSGALAAVTWASGAAIKAIVAGIPVFHDFKDWIGAPAARFGTDDLANPFLGDRMPMLNRLAWAQWSAAELATGEPFKWLLKSP
jgi:hypothetical protein